MIINGREYDNCHIFLLMSITGVFAWSLVGCYDFLTWVLEALPAIIGVALLVVTYRRFRLTGLVYFLIWVHAIILLVGAHYTYARMPLFEWIRDVLDLSRNHYDRLGHVAQGFIPAMIAREVFLRKSPLVRGRWLIFVVLCVCISISAVYELLEWLAALLSEEATAAFLGTQGDHFDTQKDMALCLAGAIASLLTLSRYHDRQLESMKNGISNQ